MDYLEEPFLSSLSTDFPIGEAHVKRDANLHGTIFNADQGEGELLIDMPTDTAHILCARASALVSQRGNATRAALKAPFIVFTILIGLWPKNFRHPQKLLLVFGIALNAYVITGNIMVYKICAAITPEETKRLSPWLCYGFSAYNETRQIWSEIFRPVLVARSCFGVAQSSGLILMVYCVLKLLPTRKNAITLDIAFNLLTRNQWIKLNLQIVFFFVIWITFEICDLYYAEHYIPKDHSVLWIKIENLVLWLYIGTPCWIFAVLTQALESLTVACFHEIKELRDANIDDVILIYTQLCSHVFSTVRALKYWFVAHWFSFGMTFAVEVAIGFKAVDMFDKRNSQIVLWVFSTTALLTVLYSFLYPSLCAASITSKCGNMLERLNAMNASDWSPDHPLRKRHNMNEFLAFANQVQCGFRIGRLTFNNTLAWFSAFLSIVGLFLKVL